MIVYDKEQKEIVIPNGIGNIDIYNNGVEAGYNEGYEQGQADMAAKARVLNVTENGVYKSKYSDPIIPTTYTVTGVYDDGTEFYNFAELNGKVFNTKITATKNSRLEFWYKGDNTVSGDGWNVIIGAGNNGDEYCFQVRYFNRTTNNLIDIDLGGDNIIIQRWDDTVWHHLIVSKAEGVWVDGEKKGDFSSPNTINGEFYINGIRYNVSGGVGNKRNANGYFGMIKIDDTTIIPTANGFLNTNTGKLLEVVHSGGYTFTENVPIDGEGELYKTINVNVPDLNGSYDEGYAQGKTDGINEQKGKLESINITENGTYTKEDGYNHIEVNVPDLNGSYDEGYEQGQTDAAANARVLDVTENGNYLSKFSDPIVPELVTGEYADGTDFYSYAELNGKVFNTNIPATMDSRVELWYKGDNLTSGDGYNNIITTNDTDNSNIFEIIYWASNNDEVRARIGSSQISANWDEAKWHHIIVSVSDGFVIDGEKKGDIQSNSNIPNGRFMINGTGYNGERNANGTFGMIKIDDTIIIPTADGFLNTNTGELIEVVKVGDYTFTENKIRYGEGELYKTINVNVIPKINVKEAGLKFGQSTFTEVPEWVDFEGVTDMSNMFNNCKNINTIPLINTSNVTNMNYMFGGCNNLRTIPLIDTSNVNDMSFMFTNCGNLQTIPLLNTSNVTNMHNMFYTCSSLQTIPPINTSNVTNMERMFIYCGNLQTIPPINTSNVTNMNYMFGGCNNLRTIPELDASKVTNISNYFKNIGDNLTDVGGWKNLKINWNDNYGLSRCPNLTYQSCINILNGLYDFVGNGSTETRTLKVHKNFLTTVGDEISIGTNKGWSITA